MTRAEQLIDRAVAADTAVSIEEASAVKLLTKLGNADLTKILRETGHRPLSDAAMNADYIVGILKGYVR